MGELHKIVFETIGFPKSELFAYCSACKTELARVGWTSYHDYGLQKTKLGKRFDRCPKCKAVFNAVAKPTWKKQATGDWKAACRNGDFLVWKHGRVYKWRYRAYGNTYADRLGVSNCLSGAQKACERHSEWKV